MNKNPIAQARSNFSTRSLARFLVIGGFATGLHYLLTLLLAVGIGLPMVTASAIGFTISAIANYLLNARLTFLSTQPHIVTAPRFLIIAGAGLLINSVLLFLLIRFGLHAAPAQIVATGGVVVWNYSIHGLWTFKPRSS